MRHRKIVSYMVRGDAMDVARGHGTHVCGSIAGDAQFPASFDAERENAAFNGMAPKARLAFTDIQAGGGDLNLPADLYADYFLPAFRDAGARLFSSSWGADEKVYSDTSRDTDRFAYDNQDFLPIFAAGNYGETGWSSIATPGNAKNSLAVGSHKSSWQSFASIGAAVGFRVVAPAAPASSLPPIAVTPAAPDFGPAFGAIAPASATALRCVLASPQDACSALTNAPADLAGACVVIVRGSCTFISKVARAQAAGAVLVLVADLSGGAATQMGKGPSDAAATVPAATIDLDAWNKLQSFLVAGTLRIDAPVAARTPGQDIDFLSSFSSRGPTIDGRFKPDLLSDGEMIVSARSDGVASGANQCPTGGAGTLSMKGTSMATPIAAGSAALVRQYYVEGWHIAGERNASSGIQPSAALVRATMIHSASPVGGTVFTVAPDGSTTAVPVPAPAASAPSALQGFGRLELARVLRFAAGASTLKAQPNGAPAAFGGAADDSGLGAALGAWLTLNQSALPATGPAALSVKDKTGRDAATAGLNTGGVDRTCVRVRSWSQPLRATLVWTDPAASSNAAVLLVNDLDLVVTHLASGAVFFGNHLSYADSNNNGATVLVRDAANTAERVTLTGAESELSGAGGLVAIGVQGFHVPIGPQPFALVLTGDFEAIADASQCAGASNFCPGQQCGRAQGRGECVTGTGAGSGRCVCAAGFGGADCAAQSRALVFASGDPVATGASSGTLSAAIAANAWAYFHVAIPNSTAGLGLRVTVARASGAVGDPDFYAAVNAFPALDSFVASEASCDSCGGPPATHSLWIAPSQLRAGGRVVIGAFAYCCDATAVTVSAAFVAGPDVVPPTPAADADAESSSLLARGMRLVFSVTGLVVACVLAAVFAGIVAVRWYRQRESQRAAHESQLHAANQVAADGFAFGGDLDDGIGGSGGGSDGMSHIELDDRSSLYQPPAQSYAPVGAVSSASASSSSTSLSASSMSEHLGGGSAEPSEFDSEPEPARAPIMPRNQTYSVLNEDDDAGV